MESCSGDPAAACLLRHAVAVCSTQSAERTWRATRKRRPRRCVKASARTGAEWWDSSAAAGGSGCAPEAALHAYRDRPSRTASTSWPPGAAASSRGAASVKLGSASGTRTWWRDASLIAMGEGDRAHILACVPAEAANRSFACPHNRPPAKRMLASSLLCAKPALRGTPVRQRQQAARPAAVTRRVIAAETAAPAAPAAFVPPALDPNTPSPIFGGSTGGLLRKAQVGQPRRCGRGDGHYIISGQAGRLPPHPGLRRRRALPPHLHGADNACGRATRRRGPGCGACRLGPTTLLGLPGPGPAALPASWHTRQWLHASRSLKAGN